MISTQYLSKRVMCAGLNPANWRKEDAAIGGENLLEAHNLLKRGMCAGLNLAN